MDCIKRDIKILSENNKKFHETYEETNNIIRFMRKETKEDKKKRLILAGIIALLIISGTMSIMGDIKKIQNKIIREHGYGMTIQNEKYMI